MTPYSNPTDAQLKVVRKSRRMAAISTGWKVIAGLVILAVIIAWIYVFVDAVVTYRDEQRDHRRKTEQRMYR